MRRSLSAGLAAGLAAVLFAGPGCERSGENRPGPPSQAAPPASGTMQATPFFAAGLRCPPAHPAADVNLADDAAVVGVLVGGKPRAYLLSALSSINRHVVNDLVADTPVTVTYCNQSDCVRAYTADTPGVPLAIDLGGWGGKVMLLRVGTKFYWQDSGKAIHPGAKEELPYRQLAYERTSWAAWRKTHPDTDVFTGKGAEPAGVPGIEGGDARGGFSVDPARRRGQNHRRP